MAEKHSPTERLQLFLMGFRRGAGMKACPDNVKDDPDFKNGYREGAHALYAAGEIARKHYGAPKPSFLRTNETTAPVIAACEDLRVTAIVRPPTKGDKPWWAGKDVCGWLYARGWYFIKEGMVSGHSPKFIPAKDIIEAYEVPSVAGPRLERESGPYNRDFLCPKCGTKYITSDPLSCATCPKCKHQVAGPS